MAKSKKSETTKKAKVPKKTSKKSKKEPKKESKKEPKKESKKASKKESKKASKTPPPAPVEEASGPCVADFLDAVEELEQMRKNCTAIKHRFQDLARYASKLEKQVKKIEQKKADRLAKNGGKPRTRGGIMKKAPISDELCEFLQVDSGTELTRNEVRNRINTYANDNGLKEGTMITLDEKLSSLFPDVSDKQLAYNGIIGQLRPHFPQTESS